MRLGDGDLLWCRAGAQLLVCRLSLGQISLSLGDVRRRACMVELNERLSSSDVIALGHEHCGDDATRRQAEHGVPQRYNLALGY